ncbi:glucose 1-dehydrogenase [Paraburkholderia sp. 1N]|uniref:Glucose 1-dehydrogenase n=1 Tax=Paraburkholderia solitsugae TaxID=2675748 RepID=A0ABX2C0A0_9BURK|nr:SDR family oxidoreductase [Paraburkholderia solitsugae]NPT46505.1 glucose 1-dehydrogenase [Paraburkholderia solitsugae]
MHELFDLSGRVAVVTGATKGMGLEIARALGTAGAKVVISGRDQEVTDLIAARLHDSDGIDVKAIACDITDPASVDQFAARALRAFGRVDTLVLSAAGVSPTGSILNHTTAQLDQVMADNVRGSFALVTALAPQMIARKDGSIIFMSSRAAKRGSALLGLYAMSKAAIDQLVRNLALELGPSNINVNSINPGAVRTDFSRGLWEDPEREKKAVASIPMGRIGEPEDVAGLALLLASPAGHYIHGQNISVDGGGTA